MSIPIACTFCDPQSFSHQIIFKTNNFYVIHARRPLARGHCIIIPIQHIDSGIGIPSKAGNEFVDMISSIMDHLKLSMQPSGINFFANFGKAAGQEIAHAHFHIVPRYSGESCSPFEKLKDPAYKNSQPLSAEQISIEINQIYPKK